MNKAIFLDRDGVINKAIMRNGKPFSPRFLKEFKILPGVKKALIELKKKGFLNIVVTSQPDIRRGLLKLEDLKKMHEVLNKELPIDDIKFCPHDDSDNCNCRKPKPGMLLEAAKKWSVELKKSFMVGDTWKDAGAARAAGCCFFLIRRRYNRGLKKDFDFEVKNLKEAVEIIKNYCN